MPCFSFFFILLLCAHGVDKLSNNLITLVGGYLEPKDSFKINASLKKWNKLEVYKNLTPTDKEVVLFEHKETNQLFLEDFKGFVSPEVKKVLEKAEAPNIIPSVSRCLWYKFIKRDNQQISLHNFNHFPYQKPFVETLFEMEISEIEKRYPHRLQEMFQKLLIHTFAVDASRSLVTVILDAMGDQNIDKNLDNHGPSLCIAAKLQAFESCKVLLERGADPNVQDVDGETPLTLSVYYADVSQSSEYVKLFLKYGTRVSLKNKRGENALALAFQIEHGRIGRYCIRIIKEAQAIQTDLREKQLFKRKMLDKIMGRK